MRSNIACSALISATLFAGSPSIAQDKQAPGPAEEQKIDVGALLKYLDGAPDLSDLPDVKSLTSNEPAFDTSQPVVGFGFQIVDDGVRIVRVLEGSAAQAAGLQVGMFVDRINGARLSDFTLDEIAKLIAAIDGELTFDIRDTGDVKLRKAPIEQQGS